MIAKETVPVFAMRGHQIIDVAYTEWKLCYGDGSLDWIPVVGATLDLDGEEADRLIFEFPTGCYEMPLDRPNAYVHIEVDGSGFPLTPCRRPTLSDVEAEVRRAVDG